ncbi:MAG: Lpg1974 family pore-forming outer membrane protein [Chlamydiota bacterium]
MKKHTLQILRYIALPCVLSCLSLNADDSSDAQMDSGMQNGDKKHFRETYEMVKMKEITPSAGTAVQGGLDVYVQADYILWHASEGGLAYVDHGGINAFGSTATSNNTLSKGQVLAPHFKTSSGFKVGLGLDFNYDGWDLGATYTWLHSHASSEYSAPLNGTNKTLLGGAFLITGATTDLFLDVGSVSGSADWKLHFNNIDLELGRNFFVSPKLTLRPHFGLKGTWQTQRFNVAYNQVGTAFTLVSQANATEAYTATNVQHYWGLGVRTGVDTSWMFTRNWSLFGDWAIAALWGQFKDTRVDVSNVANAAGASVLANYTALNLKQRTHQLNGVMELQLGLRYDYWFSDDEYRFRMAAGWENQLWFSQNHFYGLDGDLSLQGFTLNFRLDF